MFPVLSGHVQVVAATPEAWAQDISMAGSPPGPSTTKYWSSQNTVAHYNTKSYINGTEGPVNGSKYTWELRI